MTWIWDTHCLGDASVSDKSTPSFGSLFSNCWAWSMNMFHAHTCWMEGERSVRVSLSHVGKQWLFVPSWQLRSAHTVLWFGPALLRFRRKSTFLLPDRKWWLVFFVLFSGCRTGLFKHTSLSTCSIRWDGKYYCIIEVYFPLQDSHQITRLVQYLFLFKGKDKMVISLSPILHSMEI